MKHASRPPIGKAKIPVSIADPGCLNRQINLISTAENVRMALGKICQDLIASGVSEDKRKTVEMVMAELLNNVVKHAYQETASGQILICFACKNGHFCARVSDRGLKMPGGVLPVQKTPNLEVQPVDLPENGFGWYLIHSLTHVVRYTRKRGENQVYLEIPL